MPTTKKKAIKKVAQSKTPIVSVLETPENLHQHLQEFEANLPDDEQTLWNNATQFMNAEIMGFIYAGQAFKKLQDQTEHGHFRACLAERGLKARYVQQRIQIAEKFTQVQITNFDSGSHLGISKLRKISAWEDDQVVDFFEGKEVYGITIDQAQDMSVRDMEAQIKANKDEVKALTETLQSKENSILELEKENDLLKRQLEGDSLMGDWPDVINKVRNESTALSEQALLAVDDMEKLLVELQAPLHDFTELQYDVGFSTLFHHLNAIAARVQNTLTTLEADYHGSQTLNSNESVVPLGQAELQHAVNRRATLIQRHTQDKIEREKKREAKKGPRRGRPRIITETDV